MKLENKGQSHLKYCIEVISRSAMKFFAHFVPIKKNRILFYSFTGNQYSCSPKYISEYLYYNCRDEVEIVWAFRDLRLQSLLPDNIKCVKYQSIKFFYYHLSAKIIISNIYPFHLIPTRKGQLMIDTWHGGGAYKVAGFDYVEGNKYLRESIEYYKDNIDVFISSSRLFTEYFIHNGLRYTGTVLTCGLPRNDVFFFDEERQSQIRKRVYSTLGIDTEYQLILYAPTWRGEDASVGCEFDARGLEMAACKRFGGKWKTLTRMHMYTTDKTFGDAIVAKTYPDMQELLVACNILITDYSSSIWDYSLTGKPCFLYTYDLKQYERKRAFYVDIEKWGFSLCPTMKTLIEAIEDFDEQEFKSRMLYHYNLLGGYDDGHASEKVASFIKRYIGE